MRPLKRVWLLALVASAALLPSSGALAEDTKGKWQFGFGLSYFSTVDYIRSNADLAFATSIRNPDGSLASVASVDDRPDINILNQPSIRDDFKIDFSASYGLTRWLALEAQVSYLNATVGNIEHFFGDQIQTISGETDSLVAACGPELGRDCWQWSSPSPFTVRTNTFLPVGKITEIPIHLSGLIRFRPESPFDPYIGAGVGYILTDLKTGDEFNRKAAVFSDPTFRVTAADEGEFNINNRCRREGFPFDPVANRSEGCTDFHPETMTAKVRDAFEFHAVGGVDYYMTDRFSVYVDARYVWTSGSIDIRTDRAHQVRFAVADPGALQLRIRGGDPNRPYDPGDPSTWYLWEDIGVPANADFHQKCPECQNDGYLETEDKNMSGSLDWQCDEQHRFCEDEGWLYKLPPGSRDVDESLRIACPACAHNYEERKFPGPDNQLGTPDDVTVIFGFDTEDANGNGFLDRFLVYGVDICTTAQGVGNANCFPPFRPPEQPPPPQVTDPARVHYVWPEGCVRNPAQLGPFQGLTETGCPPFPPLAPNGTRPDVGTTASDNSSDTFIVQGGRIRMGGFGLGVGFKFTF